MIKFCSLYSGSTGNCIFISDEKTKLLIDLGVTTKKLIEGLKAIDEDPTDLSGILISHEHSDHVKGLKVFTKKYNVPLYLRPKVWEKIKCLLNPEVKVNLIEKDDMFAIGDICIKAFSIPHDALDPLGYSIYSKQKKITVVTDIGHISENIRDNVKNSDLLMIESNHDENILKAGKYPWFLKKRIMSDFGHLSNECAGGLILDMAKSGMKNFVLGHLSRENNFPELAYQTTKNFLDENKINVGKDINLYVASFDRVSPIFMI